MSYSPFRHIDSILWKRRPVHLTLFLTRRCNARCPYCFYRAEDSRGGRTEEELSLAEIERISSSLGCLLWLAFSGGEIFLRRDLADIAKVFYRQNRPSLMLFPTNGLMPDVVRAAMEEILQSCPKSTIITKLSLEGTEAAHDHIRGRGSFRKTMQTFDALRGLPENYPNFELGVNTVFCSANQDNMPELIEFIRGLEAVKTHTISLIRGTVPQADLKQIDIEKYQQAIDLLASNLRTRTSAIYRFRGARLKAAQDIVQRQLIHETLIRKKQLIPCHAGRLNLVLSETGDVYPCESFDMPMGNIRDYGYNVTKVSASEQALKVIRSIEQNRCYCTHECYLMTNILFSPRCYPGLFREYVRLFKPSKAALR